MSDTRRERRAVLARQLLENELLNELLDEQEAECVATWRNGLTAGIRDDAWHALRALDGLRQRIGRAIDDGTLARRQGGKP
jgi:hypothetical protein